MKSAAQPATPINLRPIRYSTDLDREVAIALERYSAQQDRRPETIIAELVRVGLGVDA